MTPEQFEISLRQHPGLIIGPGVTLGNGSVGRVAASLATAFSVDPESHIETVSDRVLAGGIDRSKVVEALQEAFEAETGSGLETLAELRWPAVLSASIDSHLEQRLQSFSQRSPARRSATVLVA